MKIIQIKIADRARKYGYVFWTKELDSEVKSFFGDRATVEVDFEGAALGKKNIDWKNRRISIGWRWTRRLLRSKKVFRMTFDGRSSVRIECQ